MIEVDWEENGILDDDSITFRIDIWNSAVKVEYFACSTVQEQVCCFQRTIKGDRDWKIEYDTHECIINIPMKFTDFWNMETFNVNFSLRVKDGNTYAIMKTKNVDLTEHFILCKYKITVQRNDEIKPFLDTEWNEIEISYKDNKGNLITERKWDYLANVWTVKIDIIIVTDVKGRIERTRYNLGMQTLSTNQMPPKTEIIPDDKLKNYMNILYNEGKFCDIMIHTNGEYFPCHKDLLCEKSPIFKYKVKHHNQENIVNIYNTESQVLKAFLTYLYLNILEITDFDSLLNLYSIAYRYKVSDLQSECVIKIKSSLFSQSIDNALKALNIADCHHDNCLKEEIINYFCENAENIKRSRSWRKLLSSEPLLAYKIEDTLMNANNAERNISELISNWEKN